MVGRRELVLEMRLRLSSTTFKAVCMIKSCKLVSYM